MKRIGILSDTHGYLEDIDLVLEATADQDIDMWLHAGDLGDDARYMQEHTNVPVYAVHGNNDRVQPLEPREQLIPLEDTYIYMTHGDKVSYYNRIQELTHLGTSMGARLIVAGHSHHHGEVRSGDAVFVNPGSISLPRDRSGGTFAIVTYDNGQFDVEFVYKQDLVQLYCESFVLKLSKEIVSLCMERVMTYHGYTS